MPTFLASANYKLFKILANLVKSGKLATLFIFIIYLYFLSFANTHQA